MIWNDFEVEESRSKMKSLAVMLRAGKETA